jgi:dTDP-glucose 4,6-dehydratase/UDP-glucose 4-epimerase
MKVLITGHKGFIGSHLVKYLSDYEVIGYDLKDGDDVLDLKKLKKIDCDVVVHLAAKCVVNESWEKPAEYFKTNIEGTANVLSLGKRVILASSCAAGTPETSPYGLSKLACEMMNPYVSLRLANVYGENQDPKHGRAIDNFIRGAKKGEITIYGDGGVRRDYIHVSDVCEAIRRTIESDITGVVGIGTGTQTSLSELIGMIKDIYNQTCEIKYKPARKEALVGFVDTTRARIELGFEPVVDLWKGLNELNIQDVS